MNQQNLNFWETKPLEQMNQKEWESLCDGCGQCCLVRLQDEETDEIHSTSVACKLLNTKTGRCSDYQNRKQRVPGCLILRPLTDYIIRLLPDTCAYRLLAQGETLPDWHPLISGDSQSVIKAGISVAGNVISENHVHPDDLDQFVIE